MSEAPRFDPKNMRFRNLGRTGLKVPVFSLGSWLTYGGTVAREGTKECLQAAWDSGINFVDTAEAYAKGQSETDLGIVLKELGWRREEMIISTKVFFGTGSKEPNGRGLSRKHIIEGVKASLQRLQLDYVDLLFCHRPDESTPIEETVRAMNWCIDTNKCYYWGTSEWTQAQLIEANEVALRLGLVGPAMEQPQYHMLHREKVEGDYKVIYERYGLGLTIWSPLAGGFLTGKYNDGNIPKGSRFDTSSSTYKDNIDELQTDEGKAKIAKIEKLTEIATKLGCSMTQLALAWCVANPDCTNVILGATKAAQIHENVKALDFVDKLTPQIMAEIDEILQNKPARK